MLILLLRAQQRAEEGGMDIHRPKRTEREKEKNEKAKGEKGGGQNVGSGIRYLVAQPHVMAVEPWTSCFKSL